MPISVALEKLLERPSTEIKSYAMKVADAVWVATALLHIRNPELDRFSAEDIVRDVQALRLTQAASKSIWQHVNQHCVANREPNPNRPRMLYALGKGDRRLFKDGDNFQPARAGSPTHPEWSSLPMEFKDLQRWYEEEWNASSVDPLLALEGTWTFGHAEEYLRNLRQGWD
jgi:hypothetical protein